MDASLPTPLRSAATTWSLVAGAYALACALLLVARFGVPAGTIGTALALPTDWPTLLLTAPAPVAGAFAWWLAVERRADYGYLLGGAVGLTTALLTVAAWTLWAVAVWGPPVLAAAALLVAAVLLVTLPVGFVAGLPLMYARRRLGSPATG
jgi:hypothetical protein